MEIEYQCTLNDYKSFFKLYFKNELKQRLKILILIPLFIAYLLSGQPFELTRFIAGFFISGFLFLGLFYLIPYLYSINKISKLILKDPEYLEKKKLIIADEGLNFENETKNGTWKWESIVSFESNTEYISIILADKRFFLIPKRAFSSDNEEINFLGVVQSKIIKIRGTTKSASNTVDKNPPYLLGLLCFIPMIGAFIGLVFIILGITRFKDKWFTLIGVFGILFTIILYSTLFYTDKKTSVFNSGFKDLSQMGLNDLVKEVEYYKLLNGNYPDSLQQLTNVNDLNVSISDPIQSIKGQENVLYRYFKVEDKYRLFSSGEDGIPNTKDDFFPQVSEKAINKIGLIKYDLIQDTLKQKKKDRTTVNRPK